MKNDATDREHAAKVERQERFLAALRGDNGVPLSVRAACTVVGVSRTTVRAWRQSDQEFSDAYDEAFEDGTDLLEDAAVERAVHGVTQDVFHAGEVCGEKTVYSDDLLKFTLAGRRPSRYRTNAEVQVAVLNNNQPVDDNQIARALALMMAEAERKQVRGDK